ncbi:MAG: hypothetical protein AB4426_06380 [Xenococcaceae cyanobacterium]
MSVDKQAVFIALTVSIAAVASALLVLIIGLKAGIIGAAIVLCTVISYKYPRIGLWIFLIYLPFGGSIIYSLGATYRAIGGEITYSADYPLFHLAKDAFYIPALIALILSGQSLKQLRPTVKPLLLALCCLLVVCLLTLLFVNLPQQLEAQPQDSPFLMGIIGLKVLMGYIPLILCAYYLIRNQQDLFFLTRLQVILTLICCGLCFLQYLFLVTDVCAGSSGLAEPALHRASLQARCFVGGSVLYNPELGLIRLPGTFVAPWQWGWFLISSSFFTYALCVGEPSRRWRLVSWVGMAFVLFAAVISGQRIALLLVPTIFLVLLLFTEQNKKWLPIKLGIIVFLGILMANNIDIVQQRLDNLVGRWNYSPPQEFIVEQFKWVIKDKVELLGHGLGRATSAARRFGDIKLIETFYPQLLYEIGVFGVLAFLGVVSMLTLLTFKAYRSVQDQSLRRLGICLWLFVLFISYNTYYYPLAVDPVAVYYWFFAGVLLKLPELDHQKYLQKKSDLTKE